MSAWAPGTRKCNEENDSTPSLSLKVPCRSEATSSGEDRKSTRLNSSHSQISYAVFCLKKKNDRVSRKWQAYRRKYHTSSKELAELAKRVKTGLLVLYHRANPGGSIAVPNPEDVLLDEIRQLYKGTVVTGHDLDVL